MTPGELVLSLGMVGFVLLGIYCLTVIFPDAFW